jgi:hypothetical protein
VWSKRPRALSSKYKITRSLTLFLFSLSLSLSLSLRVVLLPVRPWWSVRERERLWLATPKGFLLIWRRRFWLVGKHRLRVVEVDSFWATMPALDSFDSFLFSLSTAFCSPFAVFVQIQVCSLSASHLQIQKCLVAEKVWRSRKWRENSGSCVFSFFLDFVSGRNPNCFVWLNFAPFSSFSF